MTVLVQSGPAPPLDLDGAMDRVDAWLGAAPAVVIEPTVDHARLGRSLLSPIGVGGNLVSDAHLAALAIEHRCDIVCYDRDFGRLPGVTAHAPNE